MSCSFNANPEVRCLVLEDEVERLRAECQAWRECVKIDATMEGARFKGWDRSGLDRCRQKFLPHILEN